MPIKTILFGSRCLLYLDFFVTSDWDNKTEKDSVIKMSRMISIIMSLIHFLSYTVCRFAFPDISCKGSNNMWLFFIGFFYLAQCFQGSSVLDLVSVLFFVLNNKYPIVWLHTLACLSVYQLNNGFFFQCSMR